MTFIGLVIIAIATGFLTHSVALGFLALGVGIMSVELINAILRFVLSRRK